MGVYIKGMEMPTYDGVFPCRLRVENGIAKLEIDYIITALMDERKIYPLIPVPNHGRLGDLDAAIELARLHYGESAAAKLFEQLIQHIPTIIPADKEEGE